MKHFVVLMLSVALFAACDGDSSSSAPLSDSNEESSSLINSSSSVTQSSSCQTVESNYQTIEPSSSSADISSSSLVEPLGSVSGCKTETEDNCVYGLLTDERDGQSYKTVVIGAQTWMAQNLNYKADDSYCYRNDVSNCTKYGRLYTWGAAMGMYPAGNTEGACPAGWHLPSPDEWETLFDAVGGSLSAGTTLKSSTGWDEVTSDGVNGTDAFSFAALPAGDRSYGGGYDDKGVYAYFWTSAEASEDAGFAQHVFMNGYNESATLSALYKDSGFSIRCLKD